MKRAGLIVNPRAGKGSGKGVALAKKLEGTGAELRILERFEQLRGFVREMGQAGVTDLFISSGDGTIQAILTQISVLDFCRTAPPTSAPLT